jgi:hypothetical protein
MIRKILCSDCIEGNVVICFYFHINFQFQSRSIGSTKYLQEHYVFIYSFIFYASLK